MVAAIRGKARPDLPGAFWPCFRPAEIGRTAMLQRLFHVNVCVRDMDRSIRFYQNLGFNKVNDFTLNDPNVGDALGSKANNIPALFICVAIVTTPPVLLPVP